MAGYKIVRLEVEGDRIVGEEDFISGWLLSNGSSVGRPVDLIFGPEDGARRYKESPWIHLGMFTLRTKDITAFKTMVGLKSGGST